MNIELRIENERLVVRLIEYDDEGGKFTECEDSVSLRDIANAMLNIPWIPWKRSDQ